MNYSLSLMGLCLTLLLMNNLPAEPAASTLVVEVTNLKRSGGVLRVGVYKPTAQFASETAKPDFFKVVPIPKPGDQQVRFELPPGRYAVAIYHDVNNNDKMDKNMVGYPKEPFGFSNNFRPRVSAPSFNDCAFEVGTSEKNISIKLID
ncbi:DUF2141 domain-containing protein [Rhabdobacter roseus]|uniref:Uncharacterized protein (DUF2141 family) n=1 Tax=Rhabdobacter roseus TaxID=1655419 RepID=A0A840TLR7_9BACT|nr:DUF2141 domain-containing protein [Rhabdobacter roseus]MBB5284354.1 uncharacterized protein (DUF2141 family) [Rhabdobacter roseus]